MQELTDKYPSRTFTNSFVSQSNNRNPAVVGSKSYQKVVQAVQQLMTLTICEDVIMYHCFSIANGIFKFDKVLRGVD